MTKTLTTEQFIHAVAEIVRRHAPAEMAEKLEHIKLVYGSGPDGTRGVTYYSRWQNGEPEALPFVEISAFGQETDGYAQLVGTTIHELAHVAAGFEAAHGKDWKATCEALGLRCAKAAGTTYHWSMIAPALRAEIQALGTPTDGKPKSFTSRFGRPVALKPCTAAVGAKGGTSRGKGSGSRLIKVECPACHYPARVTRKWLDDVGAPPCPTHGAMEIV